MDKRKDNNPHRTAEAKGSLDAQNHQNAPIKPLSSELMAPGIPEG
ncbi:hypothetical protein ALP90_200055 [Pseudomonas amygdali pv. ulmi]|uniref:Uncharacterized protein n=1 Tax=Pseudomonas amygdali pv. ulmi TaxID=251720 RepID=A0A3M4S8S1_PSEA0|nr:hypothetical protein ALP90_200055 [Pseudomonas amygdali pv. ulmi]